MQEKLESFTKYCNDNPGLRFWQALRNWAALQEAPDIRFVLVAAEIDMNTGDYVNPEDTFYWKDEPII
jgi:hypothetical protein